MKKFLLMFVSIILCFYVDASSFSYSSINVGIILKRDFNYKVHNQICLNMFKYSVEQNIIGSKTKNSFDNDKQTNSIVVVNKYLIHKPTEKDINLMPLIVPEPELPGKVRSNRWGTVLMRGFIGGIIVGILAKKNKPLGFAIGFGIGAIGTFIK